MTTASPNVALDAAELERLLKDGCERYHVPGASLAVRSGDHVIEVAAGVLNRATGVEVTPEATFQIGSITKLFTTTLVMQLVDEGRIDLDAPVRSYLPEFLLQDRAQAETVTVRHLVTHTSGIDGDFFIDSGRGDDAVERYILAMAAVPKLHEPGQMWSYCNAGFSVAGRIIEKLTGMTWDRALKTRLLQPAGLTTMGTLPEEALLGRAAVGHVFSIEDGDFKPAKIWALPRSNGPAGATPFAAARDLLTFGWLHLRGGVAEDGSRLLSADSVGQMQQPQADLPGVEEPYHWGLGWILYEWDGQPVIGHDGGTVGQSSFLRLAPERDFGVSMLTNGGNTQALYRRVFGEVFSRAAGIQMPPLPEPDPSAAVDLAAITGTYQKLSARLEITQTADGLVATGTSLGPLSNPVMVQDLTPIDASNLQAVLRGTRTRTVLTFLDPGPDGRFRYVRSGSRLHRRVG